MHAAHRSALGACLKLARHPRAQDGPSTRRGSDEEAAEAATIKATNKADFSNDVNDMVADLFVLQAEFNQSTPKHLRDVKMGAIGDWNVNVDAPAARPTRVERIGSVAASTDSPSVIKSLEESRTVSTRTSGGFHPDAQKTAAGEWSHTLQQGDEEDRQLGGRTRRSRTSMRERRSRLSAALAGLVARSSRGSARTDERGSTLSTSLLAQPGSPDYDAAMLPKTFSVDVPDIFGPEDSPRPSIDENASADSELDTASADSNLESASVDSDLESGRMSRVSAVPDISTGWRSHYNTAPARSFRELVSKQNNPLHDGASDTESPPSPFNPTARQFRACLRQRNVVFLGKCGAPIPAHCRCQVFRIKTLHCPRAH